MMPEEDSVQPVFARLYKATDARPGHVIIPASRTNLRGIVGRSYAYTHVPADSAHDAMGASWGGHALASWGRTSTPTPGPPISVS